MRNDRQRILTFSQERASILAAQHGSAAGFRALYEAYWSYVFSVCVSMTHNATLSEDLAQDVFLQVWKKIGSYKGESRFRTWLHRVAVNTVLMYFRKGQHRISTVSLEESTLPVAERVLQSLEPSLLLEDRIVLRAMIRRLAPGHQQILAMHEIQGYGHDDISNLLGISCGASKCQLHKALDKLRVGLGLQSRLSVRKRKTSKRRHGLTLQPAA